MRHLFCRLALTGNGWAEDVRLTIDGGRIVSIETGARRDAGDERAGIVIPGLANAHSHAFQRVLAGHTEHRGPAGKDNFWSWRSRMYALAGQVDGSVLEAIATQAYCEMVATGFTSVAEFHYLHNEPGEGAPSDAMYRALAAAAATSGIRMTYVPVLYERAGFTRAEPTADQQRFTRTAGEFIEHFETVSQQCADRIGTGIGVHSLRAVSAGSLSRIARLAADHSVPMHIHIAEQQREVEVCLEHHGQRPVAWLLDKFAVDDYWCLVHATHMDAGEVAGAAASSAVAGLCPTTEANLGDGIFPAVEYLGAGGRFAVGSDSHVTVDPAQELRLLEYGQRLQQSRRNLLASASQPAVGEFLYRGALAGGAAALGMETGAIRPGARADLVVLDGDHPGLCGKRGAGLLDSWIFACSSSPVRDVMVGGEWQVRDGVHPREDAAAAAFRRVVESLVGPSTG